MKIAVVATGHIPSRWAHSINVVKHADAFQKLGHQVELLTVNRYIDVKAKYEVEDIYKWYGVNEIPIKYFIDRSLNYWEEHFVLKWFVRIFNIITGNYFFNLFHPEKEIAWYIKKNDFSLCYCRSYYAATDTINSGISTMVEIHNPEPEKNQLIMKLIGLANNSNFLKIITIHDRLKDNFVRLGVPEEKVVVLEDAVDLDSYESVRNQYNPDSLRGELNLPLGKRIVGYTGHLYKGRGVDDIIDAAANLKDIYFLIVGGAAKDIKKYKDVISNKGLSNVIFAGYVKNADIPKYCIASDILIMPYTKDTPTWQHMSPLKMFEYLAAHKPIIATDLPAITKILKHRENAVIVDEKNSEMICKAIEELIEDKRLSETIAIKNIKKSAEFTYKKRCSAILKEII